ncbi:hypothetical protein LINPERHAP1_LOCUS31728 [Linum perenne]
MDPINYETVMLLMKNLSMNLSSPRFELVVGSVKNICFTCFLIRCFVVRFGIPISFEVVYVGYIFI